jgi:hypothetical protein
MKADLTRSTFDQRKQFSRVLMQQGRVQLDSDWNEQVAILLHYMQTLAADIIGPHGGPQVNAGFEIFDPDDLPEEEQKMLGELKDGDFVIGKGRYYVDGVLCENESYVKYTDQPYLSGVQPPEEDSYLVYLDVWERHITTIEDPDIREVALGGPDTAARAKVVWQVRVDTGKNGSETEDGPSTLQLVCTAVQEKWNTWVERWQPASRGMLKARGREGVDDESDPCIVSPEARYRGAENQLYRVEIHTGGKVGRDDGSVEQRRRETTNNDRERETNVAGVPTFKWSRDNGSVTFPIRDLDGSVVTLESLGRDDHLSLKVGDLVEIVDDDYVLQGRAEPLLRVEEVDATTMHVTLDGQPSSDVGQHQTKHPLLRRWDHGASSHNDTIPLQEDTWLTLEDGIQVCFESARQSQEENTQPVPHKYRTGDYWLIPARTATGDVEWPGDVGNPEAQPPHGIDHHYAPLAIVENGEVALEGDCRCSFPSHCTLPSTMI